MVMFDEGRIERLQTALEFASYTTGKTHNFHHYPARFSPEFARTLISDFSGYDQWVLDPFMGGGTSIVEGLALGRRMVGIDLNALWLANVGVMATVLFRAAWETLSELLADPKYLGARPGMIAALHTWGQTLVLHPHLHCLVTGGGLAGDTWQAVRNGYLLPARVVMPVFRGKVLHALRRALDAGQLTLPPGLALPQLRMLLNRLGRQKWHVQIMERYAHGQGVATYLARYLRGGPLSPGRVGAWDDQTVTFRYADNRDPDGQGRGRRKLLTVAVEEFLHRWLLHVPPPGLQVVRAYGLYAPTKGAALARCRQALGQPPLTVPPTLDWQAYCAQQGEQHPERCPVCGQQLRRTVTLPPQRTARSSGLLPSAQAPPGSVPPLREAA